MHPLFDCNSAYRQATVASVWSDGGESSIRRYFHELKRQQEQEQQEQQKQEQQKQEQQKQEQQKQEQEKG